MWILNLPRVTLLLRSSSEGVHMYSNFGDQYDDRQLLNTASLPRGAENILA